MLVLVAVVQAASLRAVRSLSSRTVLVAEFVQLQRIHSVETCVTNTLPCSARKCIVFFFIYNPGSISGDTSAAGEWRNIRVTSVTCMSPESTNQLLRNLIAHRLQAAKYHFPCFEQDTWYWYVSKSTYHTCRENGLINMKSEEHTCEYVRMAFCVFHQAESTTV